VKSMNSNSLSPVSVDKSVRNSLPNEQLGEMRLERPFCLFFNHCIGNDDDVPHLVDFDSF